MFHRDFHRLLAIWAATLLAVLLWWWGIRHVGVFATLLQPVLPLILLPALWNSWRWLHARRRADRRGDERRIDDRRGDA